MPKALLLSPKESQQLSRQYSRNNREDWAEMGFRALTAMVHDSERELILAELEVRKADKLVYLAESKDTAPARLQLVARRNMSKLPLAGDYASIKERAAKSTGKVKIVSVVELAEHYHKKFRGLSGRYDNVEDEGVRLRMAAKAVAYSNCVTAHLRLAEELLLLLPEQNRSVFGLNPELDEE